MHWPETSLEVFCDVSGAIFLIMITNAVFTPSLGVLYTSETTFTYSQPFFEYATKMFEISL